MHSWQVEVLSAGTWNGDTFTRADLQEIAANFERLKEHHQVPLKFGHDEGQTLLGQADGDPALGWVTGLEARGDVLVATFSNVPSMVRQTVQAGLYRNVSSEVAYGVLDGSEQIGKVLVGVALLGADLPAVNNLADLGAYLSARELTPRRVYRFTRVGYGVGSQGRAMTESTAQGSTEFRADHSPPAGSHGLDERGGRIAHLTAELAQREAEVVRLRQREATAQEALRKVRFLTERESFANALDPWVRSGALTPHARDQALAAADAQGAAFDMERTPELTFGAGLVLKLLGTMAKGQTARGTGNPAGTPGLSSGARLSQTWLSETATAAPLGEAARQAALPATESLAREAGRLVATGRFTLAKAQAHVLAQDADLAARWLAEVNQTFPVGAGSGVLPMGTTAVDPMQPDETRISRGA